ncbi:MAG: hypothetical protein IPJ88_18395 [Myxococcales bacterium]|nr:MAG: hypothetical protein IPJ88_18395 [Myxococcales bacterium]
MLSFVLLPSCGSRNLLVDDEVDAPIVPQGSEELCNNEDDDLDGIVDEDFRDADGRYVHTEHCGGCDRACTTSGSYVISVGCEVLDDVATCIAQQCETGYIPGRNSLCVPEEQHLCLPCVDDGDCGLALGARCVAISDELRCSIRCTDECPEGYSCTEGSCIPSGGSCSCEQGEFFAAACALEDPEGNFCVGRAQCTDGQFSECEVPNEVCDEQDNDCDGAIDEDFKNAVGGYDQFVEHCGRCGGDCSVSSTPTLPLTCGGDPFAPSCIVLCEETLDGLAPGDHVDADGQIATGCECVFGSQSDESGPSLAEGDALDTNCDGADGIVTQSFYVSPDGDDNNPGSPSKPLQSISEAVLRAEETLETDAIRSHIFIAAGTYIESVTLPAGLHLHGGYRRDFRELDPEGYRVDLRAPSNTTAYGGAALSIVADMNRASSVERLAIYGRDALSDEEPAIALHVINPSGSITLSELLCLRGVAHVAAMVDQVPQVKCLATRLRKAASHAPQLKIARMSALPMPAIQY